MLFPERVHVPVPDLVTEVRFVPFSPIDPAISPMPVPESVKTFDDWNVDVTLLVNRSVPLELSAKILAAEFPATVMFLSVVSPVPV